VVAPEIERAERRWIDTLARHASSEPRPDGRRHVSRSLTNVSRTSTAVCMADRADEPPPPASDRDAAERKERGLHTRVPASLDRHLKHRARNLGMSVSTVVRNVLLNTFGLVEDIVADGTNVALSLAGQPTLPRAGGAEPDPARDAAILGWQDVVL